MKNIFKCYSLSSLAILYSLCGDVSYKFYKHKIGIGINKKLLLTKKKKIRIDFVVGYILVTIRVLIWHIELITF